MSAANLPGAQKIDRAYRANSTPRDSNIIRLSDHPPGRSTSERLPAPFFIPQSTEAERELAAATFVAICAAFPVGIFIFLVAAYLVLVS